MNNTSARFLEPKSLYVEVVGTDHNGREVTFRARFDATRHSNVAMNMDSEHVDMPDGSGMFLRPIATGEHDFSISITRARLSNPKPADNDEPVPL